MSDLCLCDNTLGNSRSNCPSIAEGAEMLIFMSTYKQDGTLNFIPLADLQTQAGIDAFINQAIVENRAFPLPRMVEVADVRGEAITQEFNDGSIDHIRKGAKNFVGKMKRIGYRLTGVIDDYKKVDCAAIIIDEKKNFKFYYDPSNPLNAYPIQINEGSLNCDVEEHVTGSSIQLSMLSFNWDKAMEDKNLRTLSAPTAYNPLLLRGLFDTVSVISGISTTGFTMTLTDADGCPISGLTDSDFTLAELSPTPGAIVITSVTETVPNESGIYTWVIPAQTSADVLAATLAKTGYDSTGVTASTITIP